MNGKREIEVEAEHVLLHGKEFPFDELDKYWDGIGSKTLAIDWAHAAARGVVAALQNRSGIKNGFDNIDEDIRKEIVMEIRAIIREALKEDTETL